MTIKPRYPLPAWAEPHPAHENALLVDPDKMYPALFEEMGVKKPTKYDVECAYQMMKLDLQHAMGRFNFSIHVRSDGERKQRWNLSMHPGTAEDVKRASKGQEAREHYKRIRGFLPV